MQEPEKIGVPPDRIKCPECNKNLPGLVEHSGPLYMRRYTKDGPYRCGLCLLEYDPQGFMFAWSDGRDYY